MVNHRRSASIVHRRFWTVRASAPKLIANMSAQKKPTSELQNLVETTVDLPVVPMVASRVIDEVASSKSTADTLAKIIGQDQALLGRILRIANSPFYRGRIPTSTLQAAIVRLGPALVRDLVISLSTQSLFKEFDTLEQEMWNHSLASGFGAQLVAAEAQVANPDEAFVAGLMHDVGKTILLNHNSDYANLLQQANADNKFHHEAEYEAYGFDHADVGGVLMGKWDLADSLVESVRFHHRIDALEEAPESARSLICVVAVADALSYSLGLSIEGVVREFQLEENPAAKILGLTEDKIEKLKETLRETYDANHELMGGAN